MTPTGRVMTFWIPARDVLSPELSSSGALEDPICGAPMVTSRESSRHERGVNPIGDNTREAKSNRNADT